MLSFTMPLSILPHINVEESYRHSDTVTDLIRVERSGDNTVSDNMDIRHFSEKKAAEKKHETTVKLSSHFWKPDTDSQAY